MSKRHLTWITTVALLSMATACQRPDAIQEEVQQLRSRTVPPAARVLSESNLTREPFTAWAAWEFETDWDWGKYTNWVAGEATGYHLTLRETNRLSFSRQLTGDTFALQIGSRAGKRIHVDFVATPD